MKNFFIAVAIAASGFLTAQNYEISTLRIGEFKIYMEKESAEKIAKKTLNLAADYDNPNKVNYFGETINLLLTERYVDEGKPNAVSIYNMTTKSNKFRTKSGIGVGSTRDQLIDTYRNYSNFEVHEYKDPENPKKSDSYFTLSDYDAGTYLTFRMENRVVVEILIGIDEGC